MFKGISIDFNRNIALKRFPSIGLRSLGFPLLIDFDFGESSLQDGRAPLEFHEPAPRQITACPFRSHLHMLCALPRFLGSRDRHVQHVDGLCHASP